MKCGAFQRQSAPEQGLAEWLRPAWACGSVRALARLFALACAAKGVTWYLKTYIVNSTRFKGVSFSQGILSSVDKQDMGLCPMRGCLSRQQEHFWNAFVCRNAKATMPGCARLRPVHSPSRRRKPDMAHVVGICGKCARKSSGVLMSAGRTFFLGICSFSRAKALTPHKSAARRNAAWSLPNFSRCDEGSPGCFKRCDAVKGYGAGFKRCNAGNYA